MLLSAGNRALQISITDIYRDVILKAVRQCFQYGSCCLRVQFLDNLSRPERAAQAEHIHKSFHISSLKPEASNREQKLSKKAVAIDNTL